MRVLKIFRRRLRRKKRGRHKIYLSELRSSSDHRLGLNGAISDGQRLIEKTRLDTPGTKASFEELYENDNGPAKRRTTSIARPHKRIAQALRELERERRLLQ